MVPRVANSATYAVALSDAPSDLLVRLVAELQGQGTPPVTARQEGDSFIFTGGESDFMLRSRAADALTTAWPAWQFNVKQPS
jgi:hypothetical protein